MPAPKALSLSLDSEWTVTETSLYISTAKLSIVYAVVAWLAVSFLSFHLQLSLSLSGPAAL